MWIGYLFKNDDLDINNALTVTDITGARKIGMPSTMRLNNVKRI